MPDHQLPERDDPLVRRLGAYLEEGDAVEPSPHLAWTGIADVRARRRPAARWAAGRPLAWAAAATAAVVLLAVLVGRGRGGDDATTVANGGPTTTAAAPSTVPSTVPGPGPGTVPPDEPPGTAVGPAPDPGSDPAVVGPLPTTPTPGGGGAGTPPVTGAGPAGPTTTAVRPGPTTTVPPAPTTTTPPPAGSFADDFSADPVGATVPSGWSVISGIWRVSETSNPTTHWAKANNAGNPGADSRMVAVAGPWADVRVQARLTLDTTSLGGVLARWQDADNHAYCVLDRSAGVVRLGVVVGGTPNVTQTGWTRTGWVDTTVSLTATGGTYECQVGGTTVLQLGAPAVPGTGLGAGAVGLWARGTGSGLTSVTAMPA